MRPSTNPTDFQSTNYAVNTATYRSLNTDCCTIVDCNARFGRIASTTSFGHIATSHTSSVAADRNHADNCCLDLDIATRSYFNFQVVTTIPKPIAADLFTNYRLPKLLISNPKNLSDLVRLLLMIIKLELVQQQQAIRTKRLTTIKHSVVSWTELELVFIYFLMLSL